MQLSSHCCNHYNTLKYDYYFALFWCGIDLKVSESIHDDLLLWYHFLRGATDRAAPEFISPQRGRLIPLQQNITTVITIIFIFIAILNLKIS